MLSLVSNPIETILKSYSPKEAYVEINDYEYILTRQVRETVKKEFDVDITKLPIPEQFHFAQFLKTVDIEGAETVKTFTKTYGESGARVFLSLEEYDKIGNAIVELGERLPPSLAGKIFEQYGKLIDASRQADKYALETFGVLDPSDVSGEIAGQLMARANNLLLRAIKESKDESDQTIIASNIETALQHADVHISLFAATCKTLDAQSESINLREIKDVVFDRFTPQELTSEDIAAMRSIYAQNYANTPKIQDDLLHKFDEVIKKLPDNAWHPVHFYTLKHRGSIVAFCSFADSENGLTFGMMNVDPKYQRSAVGQIFLDATIGIESNWATISASCSAHGPAARHYIENGFIGIRTKPYHEDLALDIIYTTSDGTRFSKEEIIAAAVPPDSISFDNPFIAIATKTPEEIPFDLLERDLVISRYFKENNTYYTVFEKPKPDTSAIIV